VVQSLETFLVRVPSLLSLFTWLTPTRINKASAVAHRLVGRGYCHWKAFRLASSFVLLAAPLTVILLVTETDALPQAINTACLLSVVRLVYLLEAHASCARRHLLGDRPLSRLSKVLFPIRDACRPHLKLLLLSNTPCHHAICGCREALHLLDALQ